MNKTLPALAALCLLAAACGCAAGSIGPVVPPRGFIYTQYKAPLTIEPESADLGSKKGTASTRYIGFPRYRWVDVAWDNATVAAAARDGGIKKVAHADYELLSVLGVYSQFTVIAYGE